MLSSIISTANDIIALFSTAKNKLLDNPEEASAKLADVLGELTLILDFIEKEMVRYLQIIFLPDKSNFIECRSTLLYLESGYTSVKGYEARGHCHKIMNIYKKYLNRWFSTVLDGNDAMQIEAAFDKMNSADDGMIDGINEITKWLKNEADTILQMADAEQLEAANQRIKAARLYLQPMRRSIVDALAQLKLLQAGFIVSSQTV